MIFLADAASMLVPIALLLGPLRHVHGRGRAARRGDADTPATYRRHPPPARRCAGSPCSRSSRCSSGYGQLEAGFPAFAREVAEVSTRTDRLRVRGQHRGHRGCSSSWMLNRITGRRRTRVMLVMGGRLGGGLGRSSAPTGLVPGSAAAVARRARCSWRCSRSARRCCSRPIPAITNDLAPDHLRGRYNAISAGAFQARHDRRARPWRASCCSTTSTGAYVALLVAGCAGDRAARAGAGAPDHPGGQRREARPPETCRQLL